MNRDLAAARTFHDATKYVMVKDESGEERAMMGTPPHVEEPFWEQDWSVEPLPYKEYPTTTPIPLPREFPVSSVPALEALGRTGEGMHHDVVPNRSVLARFALFSNGLLNRRTNRGRGRLVEFRTAGATGARYHLEWYFVCGDLPDLAAGVYHYCVPDHSLRLLRPGDHRAAVVEASGAEPALAKAPVIGVLTSTFWRNAWRYKARAYRHTFWDAGTSLAGALAVAESACVPTRVVLGYADETVNAVLGVDGVREAAVVLCALGETDGTSGPVDSPSTDAPESGALENGTSESLSALDLPVRPISEWEVEFPHLTAMHRASMLRTPDEAALWRQVVLRRTPPRSRGGLVGLDPLPFAEIGTTPIEEIILRRRSTRNYDTERPISFQAFSTLLDRTSRGFSADCLIPGALPLHDRYLIVHAVEGLRPGIYVHHPQERAVELLREGDFRRQAARLAFQQGYAGDAHVNVYFLTDLEPVLACYGNRGYRLAQLEAALHAGRLHLGAHALGLGAVGSTSFDDEVTAFFSPHAQGKSFMFVTVFGRRRPRR